MGGTFVKLRITDQTADVAQRVHKAGELVELRDRKGEVHTGWVREISYEVGLDQGWFVWFEHRDDYSTRDVIANLLGQHGQTANGSGAAAETKTQDNRAKRRRQARR
jgi:hypothetical protein